MCVCMKAMFVLRAVVLLKMNKWNNNTTITICYQLLIAAGKAD